MRTKLKRRTINKIAKYIDVIELNPSFQREKVWSLDKQQYFLDSILQGWGVPKFYLAAVGEKGKETYLCVDGKQRLTSIFAFLSGNIKLSNKYPMHPGKNYKELSRSDQEKFDDYLLSVEEVYPNNEDELSELYRRLQRGSPLNSGENFMSINGAMKNFVKRISSHNFFKKKVYLANTRYSHFNICVQIAFLEINGITDLNFKKLETFLKYYRNLLDKGSELNLKFKKIKFVLDYLNELFPEKNLYFKNRASIVSAYLLVSELSSRTNIIGKEGKIKNYFVQFMEDLKKENNKGGRSSDVDFLAYQNATIQGADKQKNIKIRQEIMFKKMYILYPEFYSIMNSTKSPEKIFSELYEKLAEGKNSEQVDKKIISINKDVRKIKCVDKRSKKITIETLPTHIRHVIHHKWHGKFSDQELSYSIKILEVILRGLG